MRSGCSLGQRKKRAGKLETHLEFRSSEDFWEEFQIDGDNCQKPRQPHSGSSQMASGPWFGLKPSPEFLQHEQGSEAYDQTPGGGLVQFRVHELRSAEEQKLAFSQAAG